MPIIKKALHASSILNESLILARIFVSTCQICNPCFILGKIISKAQIKAFTQSVPANIGSGISFSIYKLVFKPVTPDIIYKNIW